MQGFAGWYHSFWPQAILTSRRDRLVACIGAGLGLMATEWLSRRVLGAANPWFMASMGVSALLLFAVPASPLAQPWALIGGNLVSALIGVGCARWIDSPGLAGRSFPHRALHAPDHRTTDRPPSERVGISRADLHAVLAERGELLDISEDDLQEILLQAEFRSHGRRSSALAGAGRLKSGDWHGDAS